MAISSCLWQPQFSLKINRSIVAAEHWNGIGKGPKSTFVLKSMGTELSGSHARSDWCFGAGPRAIIAPTLRRSNLSRKRFQVYASWLTSPQLASNVFTFGTAAVLPFYTLMVATPKAELTRKCMKSSIPYVVLGVLYAYLLYLSWTPDTLRLMFASKYWLPELPGIAKMFSNEMTLASAWIHLLAVDLFAARQVYQDGLENEIETRHSVSLCLLFCPIGVVSHTITRTLTNASRKSKHEIH